MAITFQQIHFGCKVNLSDTHQIAFELEKFGFQRVRRNQVPDIILFHSCTVTDRADRDLRKTTRTYRRRFPDSMLIITGCAPHRSTFALEEYPRGTVTVSTLDLSAAAGQIRDLAWKQSGLKAPPPKTDPSASDFPLHPFFGKSRYFLKIQDGCTAHCAYCIVRLLRGPLRSLPLPTTLHRLQQLRRAGIREVILTGIALGQYGIDMAKRSLLPDLLDHAQDEVLYPRLRLSSLEPHDLTAALIRAMAASPLLCPHFHIPLQSGNDHILQRMNRKYTTAEYRELIESLMHRIPHANLGTDIIVGFPGEDEQAYEDTHSLIRKLPFRYLHVFRYSPRPGTPAESLTETVRYAEKKRRSAILRALDAGIREIYRKSLIGQNLSLVMLQQQTGTSHAVGLAAEYVEVEVRKDHPVEESILHVTADGMINHRLTAPYPGPADEPDSVD